VSRVRQEGASGRFDQVKGRGGVGVEDLSDRAPRGSPLTAKALFKVISSPWSIDAPLAVSGLALMGLRLRVGSDRGGVRS
jgi:hypothetical protein